MACKPTNSGCEFPGFSCCQPCSGHSNLRGNCFAPGTGLATSVAPHLGHFIVSVSFERSFLTITSDPCLPSRKVDNLITANRTCPTRYKRETLATAGVVRDSALTNMAGALDTAPITYTLSLSSGGRNGNSGQEFIPCAPNEELCHPAHRLSRPQRGNR